MKNTIFWKFFKSVKLSIVIFIAISILCMVGTLVPQLEKERFYLLKYGDTLYSFFKFINIFDIYHSYVFISLVALLALNLIVCSLDKIKASFKLAFKTVSFRADKVKNYPIKVEFSAKEKTENLKKVSKEVFNKFFKVKEIFQTDIGKSSYFFGDKGRISYLGVYIVHFGILLVIIGVLIDSIFGFEAFVEIKEGKGTNVVHLKKSKEKRKLDFYIFCKDFDLSFYENDGTPKEYRSSLALKKDDKILIEKDIIVNSPLRYKGINIFQSSYDIAEPKSVTLNIQNRDTGMTYNKTLKINEEEKLPADLGKLEILGFTQSYKFAGHSLGPTFFARLTKKEKQYEIVLPISFPKFDSMRKRDTIISVINYDKTYITGLQVTKEPGVFCIYFGFILVIIGLFISFFITHNSFCIILTEDGDKTNVLLCGKSNKNKISMGLKLDKIKYEILKSGEVI